MPAPKKLPIKPSRPGRGQGTTSERGYGWAHQKQRARLLRDRPLCEVCRSAWSTDLHHIDGNPHNHSDSNAVMVCQECHHTRIHGR